MSNFFQDSAYQITKIGSFVTELLKRLKGAWFFNIVYVAQPALWRQYQVTHHDLGGTGKPRFKRKQLLSWCACIQNWWKPFLQWNCGFLVQIT